jgi:hypothetical protein
MKQRDCTLSFIHVFSGHMGHEGQYLSPQDMMPPSSPEPLMHPDEQYLMTSLPPRSLAPQFQPHSSENWG